MSLREKIQSGKRDPVKDEYTCTLMVMDNLRTWTGKSDLPCDFINSKSKKMLSFLYNWNWLSLYKEENKF